MKTDPRAPLLAGIQRTLRLCERAMKQALARKDQRAYDDLAAQHAHLTRKLENARRGHYDSLVTSKE